jgi:ribonuclease MRP protein subunit RMP1
MLIGIICSCRAFSTVVADNQFAALGVVLIAVLARVGRIVGLPEATWKDTEANAEGKPLLASSVRGTARKSPEAMVRDDMEDMGNVIEREAVGGEPKRIDGFRVEFSGKKSSFEDVLDTPGIGAVHDGDAKVGQIRGRNAQQEIQKSTSQSRPRKKRRKGNAIDDLFDNLI